MKRTYVQRNYKDTIFRMLFREKENLLSLYNALNGTDFQPKQQALRLSDAFEKKAEKPELELLVTVYNINRGHNPELMEGCRGRMYRGRHSGRIPVEESCGGDRNEHL